MQATAADDILLGLGYEPVDIESYTGHIRALKETIINLTNKNPKDPRIATLVDAVKRRKSEREAEKSGGKSRTAKRRKSSKSVEELKEEIRLI